MIKRDKPIMIFLPGKSCDQRVWEFQMQALSSVVTPVLVDLRYHETLDEMLNAILLASDAPFVLAGFSLGGYVAQEFILKYPQKVKALALVGCSAKGYTMKERENYRTMINEAKKNKVNVMSGSSLKPYLSPAHFANKNLVKFINDMVNDAGPEVFIRQQTATLNRECRFEDLSKLVDCPTIVIGGADDEVVNLEDVELTAKAISGAQYHAIKECGHMIPLEQPEILSHLLSQWLTQIIF